MLQKLMAYASKKTHKTAKQKSMCISAGFFIVTIFKVSFKKIDLKKKQIKASQKWSTSEHALT